MSLSSQRALSAKEQADRYERAHLIAALLTRIYGPEAERYFDEAFGTNCSDTDSYSASTRHPHEFQRMSAQIGGLVGLGRIPWDPLKHPRGRDGRFIEKYGIDAYTAAQSKINASLDPNATPQTTRASDDIRPLLEHFNILDHSQLHNLLTHYEQTSSQSSTKTVAPDSLVHKVNYQVHGGEAEDAQVDQQGTEAEDADSNADVDSEGEQRESTNNSVQTEEHQEAENETGDEAPSEEAEPDSDEDEEGLNDEEETLDDEDSEPQESNNEDREADAESEEEFESDHDDDSTESDDGTEDEGELLFGGQEAVEPKPEIRTGRSGQLGRSPEAPADKVLSGVLNSGGELFQSIADLPHQYVDGNKDSTRKIQKSRQQEQASVAVLTQMRDELYKTYAKYMGYQQARGTSPIPREKQLEIQHQLAQLSQLIGKVDTLIRSSRESEHNMYEQEKVASLREYKQAAAHAPPGVNVIPAPVQPSLIQSDINYYGKEIALTIATAPLGGIVFRLAGKGLKALKALRATRAAKVSKAAKTGKVLTTSKAVGGWKCRPPGIQVRKIGGYWVKRVDPKASKLMQAWAKETIRAQEAALLKLQKAGSPAAKFKRLKDGSLAIEDVGPTIDKKAVLDPNYWKALFRDSKVIGVVNDLKPGNYGAGYRPFDPAIDRYTLAAAGSGGVVIAGGVLYLLDANGIVHIIGEE